jgi:hypothetical protein
MSPARRKVILPVTHPIFLERDQSILFVRSSAIPRDPKAFAMIRMPKLKEPKPTTENWEPCTNLFNVTRTNYVQ